MTATVETVLSEPATERRSHVSELRAATARLRTGTMSDTERWLLRGGAILVPLGVVFIVLGYWGASHSPRVIQQIPYLISGGLLGLGLVFGGGFSYFAWWLTRIAREQSRVAERVDAQTDALVAELASLREELRESAGSRAAATTLVSTPTGSLVHAPSCRLVAGRSDVRPAPSGRPCKICRPEIR